MTYRFGGFSLDAAARQLLSEGREIHLSPKAFALLLVLIEHRARALSKAELQDMLWPSTFIGETNLATLVAEIRRALDDAAHEPVYVRTVHRFGYRFIADVTEGRQGAAGHHPEGRMYLKTAGGQYLLGIGETVIGRGADATIRIDSGGVSRHHARVTVSPQGVRLEDLGSKNGTFLRGERIDAPQMLRDGDEIRLGPVSVLFAIAPPTGATETMK